MRVFVAALLFGPVQGAHDAAVEVGEATGLSQLHEFEILASGSVHNIKIDGPDQRLTVLEDAELEDAELEDAELEDAELDDAELDDVETTTPTNDPIYNTPCGSDCCDFEDGRLCGWVKDHWVIDPVQHLYWPFKAASGRMYLYWRSDWDTPTLRWRGKLGAGASMSFAYSMYATEMPRKFHVCQCILQVHVQVAKRGQKKRKKKKKNVAGVVIWTRCEQQLKNWRSANINLGTYAGQYVVVDIIAPRNCRAATEVAIDSLTVHPTGQPIEPVAGATTTTTAAVKSFTRVTSGTCVSNGFLPIHDPLTCRLAADALGEKTTWGPTWTMVNGKWTCCSYENWSHLLCEVAN